MKNDYQLFTMQRQNWMKSSCQTNLINRSEFKQIVVFSPNYTLTFTVSSFSASNFTTRRKSSDLFFDHFSKFFGLHLTTQKNIKMELEKPRFQDRQPSHYDFRRPQEFVFAVKFKILLLLYKIFITVVFLKPKTYFSTLQVILVFLF